MLDLDFAEGTFGAAISLHAITRVPRTEQAALLRSIHGWLRPGGTFLATWAVLDWEGEEENWRGWGSPMRWSNHDRQTNLHALRGAGFEVVSAQERDSGGEVWLWVLARKPAR